MIKRAASSTNRLNRKSLIAGMGFLAVFLFFTAQAANGTTLMTGSTSTTAVSGFKGSIITAGDPDSATHALYGILSRERSDNPCLVTTKKEHINDTSKDTSQTKDLCGKKATSSDLYVDFGDNDATGTRTFLSGVRVCMNSKKSRVKGFQIRGKEISTSGTLVELRSGDSNGCSEVFKQGSMEYRICGGIITEPKAVRTNCDTWMKWADCPDGMLATAAALHFEAGKEPRSLTGIALKCRTVSP